MVLKETKEDIERVRSTGKRYPEADEHSSFEATYRGRRYLFIENYWGDHWAVCQNISFSSDEDSPMEHLTDISRKAALLKKAGYTPEILDDSTVLWTRGSDTELWSAI